MKAMNLDILVNNALTSMKTRHFHQSDPAEFLASFSNNVMPTLRITQQAIKEFRKRKAGRIITVLTSYLVNSPPVGLSEYVANKAYLLSLSRSWSAESARYGITANCVSPSMMKTSLTSHLDDRQIEDVINNSPLRRLVTPDEVADAVFYLATASPQINGVNLLMNGGADVI
jgi:3-oxoacyl-[acyl-carrier protein] reductase